MSKPGQFPHQMCGRLSDEQFDTLQKICDRFEAEKLEPAKLIDGLRFLLDSKPARRFAGKIQ